MISLDEPDRYSYANESGLAVVSARVIACEGCGRMIFVQAINIQLRSIPSLHAECLECLSVRPEFAADYPEIAAKIDGWKRSMKEK